MRAHFDIPASPDTDDGLQKDTSDMITKEDQPQPLASGNETKDLLHDRIIEFKSDSSKMAVVGEFIDDVLQKAEEEANKQQNPNSQQPKTKTPKQSFAIPDFKNGKVVNKARGFVVRLFESICNCANNATTAPVTRFKFRSGKRASTSGAAEAVENNGKVESSKKEEKSKKTNNGKKNEKVKIAEENEIQETIELQ